MGNAVKHLYEFGPFQLDVSDRALRRGPERIDLPPRVFDTLVALTESDGRLLAKDDLMDRVWPDSTVEENNLTQAIYLLRKVLQDGENGARYIETVPKRGYRFVAPVRATIRDVGLSGSHPAAPEPGLPAQSRAQSPLLEPHAAGRIPKPSRPATRLIVAIVIVALAVVSALSGMRWLKSRRAAALPHSHALAVLPLQNLSKDAAQDYFVDGFTEELVTDIAQIHSLRVISRTSTMVYKGTHKPLPEIARELHVDLILEGSVVRDGDRVRVTAQLINAPTDTHLWAQTYESTINNILDIQSQISRAIAEDVRLDLSPEEKQRLASVPAVDPEAHDLYLKGGYQFSLQTPDSIRQSLTLFQSAAAKDPRFAMAYVGIAQAEAALLQITAETPEESTQHEREALAKALEIDPHLGDAHGLLASLSYYQDWDWPGAEREFKAALAEGARGPTEQRYGFALLTRGRFDEGNAHIQSALELDPLGNSPRVTQILALILEKRFAEARQKSKELVSSNPNFLAAHILSAVIASQDRDCNEDAAQTDWIAKNFPSPVAQVMLASPAVCRGDFADARRHLQAAAALKPGFASPYQLALGYASIHDRETAIAYLQKSAEMREPQILFLKIEYAFDELRSDPRFLALERRLGLI